MEPTKQTPPVAPTPPHTAPAPPAKPPANVPGKSTETPLPYSE